MSNRAALARIGSRLLAAAALLALLYPLTIGPACWALSWFQWDVHRPEVAGAVSAVYCPLAPAIIDGPEPARRVFKWWMALGMPARTEFHHDWPRGVGWSNPGYTYTLWHY